MCHFFIPILSVIMLNVNMLGVLAPFLVGVPYPTNDPYNSGEPFAPNVPIP
jgi:hypothetical protein